MVKVIINGVQVTEGEIIINTKPQVKTADDPVPPSGGGPGDPPPPPPHEH